VPLHLARHPGDRLDRGHLADPVLDVLDERLPLQDGAPGLPHARGRVDAHLRVDGKNRFISAHLHRGHEDVRDQLRHRVHHRLRDHLRAHDHDLEDGHDVPPLLGRLHLRPRVRLRDRHVGLARPRHRHRQPPRQGARDRGQLLVHHRLVEDAREVGVDLGHPRLVDHEHVRVPPRHVVPHRAREHGGQRGPPDARLVDVALRRDRRVAPEQGPARPRGRGVDRERVHHGGMTRTRGRTSSRCASAHARLAEPPARPGHRRALVLRRAPPRLDVHERAGVVLRARGALQARDRLRVLLPERVLGREVDPAPLAGLHELRVHRPGHGLDRVQPLAQLHVLVREQLDAPLQDRDHVGARELVHPLVPARVVVGVDVDVADRPLDLVVAAHRDRDRGRARPRAPVAAPTKSCREGKLTMTVS